MLTGPPSQARMGHPHYFTARLDRGETKGVPPAIGKHILEKIRSYIRSLTKDEARCLNLPTVMEEPFIILLMSGITLL